MVMTNQRINDNIRAELARKRMTQQQVASVLELSQASVSDRLVGRTAWKVNELTRLAEALDVPVASLLDAPSASRAS